MCLVPKVRDLDSELQDVNDWMKLGLNLEIKMSKLEEIETDWQKVAICRIKMLSEWQKKVIPTWSAVVQALDEMGMKQLAIELAQIHGWLMRG